MSIPVPTLDPLPGPIEIEARGMHAQQLRRERPGITDREILDDWDAMGVEARGWLLVAAHHQMMERLAQPAKPDDIEALVARLRLPGGTR